MIITAFTLGTGTNWGTQIAINSTTGGMMFRSKSTTWRDWIDISAAGAIRTAGSVESFGDEGDAFDSLADLPANTIYVTKYAPDRPAEYKSFYGLWVMTVRLPSSPSWMQLGLGARTGLVAQRWRYGDSGDYSDWFLVSGGGGGGGETQHKSVKLLCLGGSYTQDNMSYVPFLMQKLAPDIDLTLGICHYHGAKLNEYITFFDEDSRVFMYSKMGPGDSTWTNYGSNNETNPDNKTVREVLEDEDWDMITFQQASTQQCDWSSYENLNTLIDKIVGYVRGLGNRNVQVGWMLPHLRKAIETETSFDELCENTQRVLQTTPVSFVLPCGTAVQNARGTSLDDLGASGHLTYDSNGHLQEGLPCILGAYAATLKLMEMCGDRFIGIMGDNTLPTAAWLSSKNIPIPHGESVGATTETVYLAQKCAIAAVKFPFELTAIAE